MKSFHASFRLLHTLGLATAFLAPSAGICCEHFMSPGCYDEQGGEQGISNADLQDFIAKSGRVGACQLSVETQANDGFKLTVKNNASGKTKSIEYAKDSSSKSPFPLLGRAPNLTDIPPRLKDFPVYAHIQLQEYTTNSWISANDYKFLTIFVDPKTRKFAGLVIREYKAGNMFGSYKESDVLGCGHFDDTRDAIPAPFLMQTADRHLEDEAKIEAGSRDAPRTPAETAPLVSSPAAPGAAAKKLQ